MTAKLDATVAQLRQFPLFGDCTQEQLRVIAAKVRPAEYATGTVLCVEGERGAQAFFVIESGEAEVERGGRVVARLGRGNFFGEIALLDDGARTATVTAASPLSCLVLGPPDFMQVLRDNPDVAVTLLRTVTQRLRQLMELQQQAQSWG